MGLNTLLMVAKELSRIDYGKQSAKRRIVSQRYAYSGKRRNNVKESGTWFRIAARL